MFNIIGLITILFSSSLTAQVISEKKEEPTFIWIEAEQGEESKTIRCLDYRYSRPGGPFPATPERSVLQKQLCSLTIQMSYVR